MMGSIYEQAYFTIAASSAADSSQGLFKARSYLPRVKFPYYDQNCKPICNVSAYTEPDLTSILSSAPLSQRAWVLQESILSRRTAHFTTNGLI